MNRDVARLTDGRVAKVRFEYERHNQPWPKQHETALREHMLSYEYGKFRTGSALEWFIAYVKASAVYYDPMSFSFKLPALTEWAAAQDKASLHRYLYSGTGRAATQPQMQNIPSPAFFSALVAAYTESTTTKGNTMKVSFIQAGRNLNNQAAAAHHIYTFSTPLTIRVTDDAGNSSERFIQCYDRTTHQRADDIVSDAVSVLKAAHLKQFPAKYTNQAAKDEAVRVAKVKLELTQRIRSAAELALEKARVERDAAVKALDAAVAKGVVFDGPDFLIERMFDMVGGQWKIVHQPSGHVTSGLPSYKDAEQLVKQRQRECGASTSFLSKYYKTLIDGTVITTN